MWQHGGLLFAFAILVGNSDFGSDSAFANGLQILGDSAEFRFLNKTWFDFRIPDFGPTEELHTQFDPILIIQFLQ